MDIKQKQKQYYIDNQESIKQKNLQYYYNNKEERQRYNKEYWALNGHKYVEKRSKDDEFKSKQSEYYRNYRQRPKYIYQDNFFKPTSLNDFIVRFD